MLTGVGAAIHYGRAVSARTAFQTAVDSTTLMLSRTAATSTSAQLSAQATSILNALFSRSDVSGVTVSTSYQTTGGSKFVLNASANISTEFLSFLGYSTIPINAKATPTWGSTLLRAALALDNTPARCRITTR